MEKNRIAAYTRISVDTEINKDNTSIENQKAIIDDYCKTHFPTSVVDYYEDRDRSGYTFEQRPGYMSLRPKLMKGNYNILIIKDLSRFSRRTGRGLAEFEDIVETGVRIIAIGDDVDYPTRDDWMKIKLYFFVNEMPVTDASKKVSAVIKSRQSKGEWLCSVPYGYVIVNAHRNVYAIDEPCAPVVREIFRLYNEGWGYRKIANHLSEQHIPTPRMRQKELIEQRGEDCKIKCKDVWSIITIQNILMNDFYIGTFRQHKYTRAKINGEDVPVDESEHIVFENHHEPIVDYSVFALTQELMKQRTTNSYRGKQKYDNMYTGVLFCGDCGSPMFSRSRPTLKPGYVCGAYQKRGTVACSSHHIRVDVLDDILKTYIKTIKENSEGILEELNEAIKKEESTTGDRLAAAEQIHEIIEITKDELKTLVRQKARDMMKEGSDPGLIEQTYDVLISEAQEKIEGLQNQVMLLADGANNVIRANRSARTVMDVFDDIIKKDSLDKRDISIMVERIVVYEDRLDIMLKSDIDSLLKLDTSKGDAVNFEHGTADNSQTVTQSTANRKDKVYRVNVINDGDPLEIFTNSEGEVIFKKYSPVGDISDLANQYAEVLAKIGGCPAAICDRDHVIAVSGMQKKEVLERRVSSSLEDVIEGRKPVVYASLEDKRINPIEGVDKYAIACAPIVAQGDVNGAVVMLSGGGSEYATPEQTALVKAAAMYFSKQMEE